MSRSRNYVKGLTTGYVATFATVAVGLWLTPFTLRFLDREEYAIFALANDLLMWLGLLDIGITSGLNVQAAQLSGRPEPERVNRLASTAFFTQNVVVVAILLVGGALTFGFSHLFPVRPELHRTTTFLIAMLVLGSAISFSTRTFSVLLVANQQIHIDNIIRLLLLAIRTVLTVIFLKIGWGLYSLAIANLAATVITSAMAVLRTFHLLPGLQIRRHLASWDVLKSIAGLGVWFSLANLSVIVISSLDRIIAAKMISVASVTTLTLTGRVYALSGGLLNQLSNTAFPMLGQLLGQEKKALAERVFRQMFTLSTGLALVAAVSLWAGNEAFVTRWVGAQNFGGPFLSLALALSLIVNSWIFPHRVILSSALLARPQTLCRLVEAALNLGVSLVLGRYLGLLGIVLGTSLAGLLTSLWYLPLLTARFFERPWLTYMREDALPIVIVGALLAPVAYACSLASNRIGGFPGALLGAGTAGAVGCGLLWAIAFDRSVRARLIQTVARSRQALFGSAAQAASRG
jgi:O-antigen/teichoic acid export membrane protein